MPSTTPAQQRLMGQAYAVKTGKLDPKDLDPEYKDQIVKLADSMTKKQLEDFAKTKHSEMKESKYEMKNIPTFESFINESLNEKMDTKYWADYNDDTSIQGSPSKWAVKSTNFEDAFEEAVVLWNQEAEGPENRIKGAQIKKIEKLAREFFKIERWISINVVQAMIMQES
jgi:hypothetical protein